VLGVRVTTKTRWAAAADIVIKGNVKYMTRNKRMSRHTTMEIHGINENVCNNTVGVCGGRLIMVIRGKKIQMRGMGP